jgi:hypothetical protein
MRLAKTHSKADLYLLGYTDIRIHELMDAMVKIMGPSHRMIGHDIKFIDFIGSSFGDKGRRCALLHLFLDLDIIDSKWVESKITKKRKQKCQ